MIKLKRLNGSEFMLNSDMIVHVEAKPDTVIIMTDGTKYVVADGVADVYRGIVKFRADILAAYRKKLRDGGGEI